MQALPVDHAGREDVHRDALGAGENGAVELLAGLGPDLLRIVQERQRAHAVVAEAPVVEQHAGDDQRPCQRPAARLVGAGDEPAAERAVEPE